MSCGDNYIDSSLFICCKDEEQLRAVLKFVEDDMLFHAYRNKNAPLTIFLEFRDPEMWYSIEHDLEVFAGQVKELFCLCISGYLTENVNGELYRCEFNADGTLHDMNTAWLLDYSIDQIQDIQNYAEHRYGRSDVKLFCSHCRKTQLVTANIIRLEHGRLNVVTDTKGHCELDWDTGDISGDFEYVCEECGERIAADLCEVEERLKQEKR